MLSTQATKQAATQHGHAHKRSKVDITVIICTYNRAKSLRQTLESLRQMTVPPELEWELLVVDNNSTDNTRATVEEFAKTAAFNVRCVFEPRQGLCHARNAGVANAKGEIIVFTDDDVFVAPEWLRELMDTFRKFDCAGAGGKNVPLWAGLARPKWLCPPGTYYLGDGPLLDLDLGEEATLTNVPPWGLNMAFKKSAFEKYGLFRTDLDLVGSGGLLGGDIDFGKRLIRAGEKIAYSPKAVVHHPVTEHRITRAYFLSYYLRLGRTYARLNPLPPEAVLWFGVPCWIFIELSKSCLSWMTTFETVKRFYYKAHTYCYLARISETWKLRREAPRSASSREQDQAERQPI